jgi:hypothetical protein
MIVYHIKGLYQPSVQQYTPNRNHLIQKESRITSASQVNTTIKKHKLSYSDWINRLPLIEQIPKALNQHDEKKGKANKQRKLQNGLDNFGIILIIG